MKKIFQLPIVLLAASLASFTPQHSPQTTAAEKHSLIKTGISWKKTEISLGEIPQNKPVTIEFEFTNTGDSPVMIQNVQAGCGCTSTSFSKTPVLPGESTKISAVFNAATKGAFNKQVTVITSAEDSPRALSFTGTVI